MSWKKAKPILNKRAIQVIARRYRDSDPVFAGFMTQNRKFVGDIRLAQSSSKRWVSWIKAMRQFT